MKRFVTMMLVLMLFAGCMPMASAAKEIATNNGLTVLSPEQYLGIDPCTGISHEGGNWYKYNYADRGLKWKSHGNSSEWTQFKTYVDALVDSGYYKILSHGKPDDDVEFWCLGYIGSGSVNKTFKVSYTDNYAAIVVRCNIGDAGVYYSLDITVDDLDETQKRLGKDIGIHEAAQVDDSKQAAGTKCSYCDGTGKCKECGGDMWVWKWEWYYENGVPKQRQVNKLCQGTYCTGGSCSKCGGDGRR